MEPRVLFVCLHGSAKSVITAEHCRRLAAARGVRVIERRDDVPAVSENFTRARAAIVARVTTLLDEIAGRR